MFTKIKQSPRIKWVLIVLLGLLALLLLFFASIYFGLWGKLPSSTELKELEQDRATQVLSSEKELIGKFYIYDRQPVSYKEFPQHLIDALIATEDVRFFEHNGIDSRSLLRVFFKTVLLGDESSGGGSTITLQLAKNLYGRKNFGAPGLLINKLQEAIIAERLEDIYSKKEILTLYLNTVPFSDNTFGIESAAAKFFNKHTGQLSLEEAAVLVGMLKASHYYNPRIFPERSRLRRDVVLVQMAKYGFLTEEEAENAKKAELVLDYKNYSHDEGVAPYFREQVRKDVTKVLDTLTNKDGKKYNIYRDGLVVHTTLNYKMQTLAEEVLKEHMAALQEKHENSYGDVPPWRQKQVLQDALQKSRPYKNLEKEGLSEDEILERLEKTRPTELFEYEGVQTREVSVIDSVAHYLKFLNSGFLAVEPTTGKVQAWIGGVDFSYFQYDHVSQSKRQVGSTFKPIVYTTALEQGIEPCTYYSPREVTYKEGWTPKNANLDEEDPHMNYNMEKALSQSINTIAVKILMQAGIEDVIQQAKKMGITSSLPAVPSIALGTPSLSLKELTKAYTAYMNNGRPSTPYYITKIEDGEGNLLAEFDPVISQNRAFSETTRQVMVEMMKATVNKGTASRLRHTYGLTNDIAGKTGTTQDNKDGWFVGITPNLVAVTWVGADDHRIGFRNTAIGQGANSALPVFAKLMQKMNDDREFKNITQARFAPVSTEVAQLLDCNPEKRDGFFKRLFSNRDKEKKQEEEKKAKKKKGFFRRLFGKKD